MAVERVDYSSDLDYEMALAQEEHDNMTQEQRDQAMRDDYYAELAESLKNEPMPESSEVTNNDEIPF